MTKQLSISIPDSLHARMQDHPLPNVSALCRDAIARALVLLEGEHERHVVADGEGGQLWFEGHKLGSPNTEYWGPADAIYVTTDQRVVIVAEEATPPLIIFDEDADIERLIADLASSRSKTDREMAARLREHTGIMAPLPLPARDWSKVTAPSPLYPDGFPLVDMEA